MQPTIYPKLEGASLLDGEPVSLGKRVRHRLLRMTGALGGLFGISVPATAIINHLGGTPEMVDAGMTLSAVAALLCGIAFWSLRRTSAQSAIYVGWVFEVLLCLLVSYGSIRGVYLMSGYIDETTWVVGLIILFALVVPMRPRQTFLVGLAAAATAPLSLWLFVRTGTATVPAFQYFNVVVNPLFAVGAATLASRVVYGLHLDVERAQRMGSYRLTELLGEGGMGDVWRAEHQLLARPAAVKVIKPTAIGGGGRDSRAVLQRFAREARTTAQLRSPHTVEVFDFGFDADGEFYYVMELLVGLDLDSLVRRHGPVPVSRAVHLLRQACHSLQEAHTAGLVHRDIKPANLHACRYGLDVDFVKVLDFGLVTTHRAPAADSGITHDNVVVGTPAFMAPEMVLGDRKIDGRADLYALGCVAFWLVTGQLVFEASTPAAMLVAHSKDPPRTPSSATELDLPARFDDIVLACLAKSPDQRPQTPDELAALLNDLDVDTWTEADAESWWSTHEPSSAGA